MRFLNEGQCDRSVRMLAGILVVAAGWTLASTAFGVALFTIGAIVLGTGVVGWCPVYTRAGFLP